MLTFPGKKKHWRLKQILNWCADTWEVSTERFALCQSQSWSLHFFHCESHLILIVFKNFLVNNEVMNKSSLCFVPGTIFLFLYSSQTHLLSMFSLVFCDMIKRSQAWICVFIDIHTPVWGEVDHVHFQVSIQCNFMYSAESEDLITQFLQLICGENLWRAGCRKAE